MTPHPGESARLLKAGADEVQSDRPAALRKLSKHYANCCVALKGHQTLVGRRKGPVFYTSSGNPYLAHGGRGDVLARYLGGWLAQPELQAGPATKLRSRVRQPEAA